ncbi:uncharacterized protein LOC121755637 isoform X1 [Salvia splendens]|uniref:uncharacterized protein LOC121755637 isoform X1 n=1 Tax=Salvia splendens TaxID=180675 RepID=UPI001C274D1A|nr:uncharacterized protein LOC121755637 isoform X1 [Salvia splendens]XP_042006893.1 uncharacterized protein LOC121755637 isoform X1 [Salvia splendens]XP_042006894.1 uncharacterized protein LOC121755637 isoform X1 [Salvia splendens]
MTAQQEVAAKMSIQVTESEIKQGLDFMKLRYDIFKRLQDDGASWDVGAAFVRASDDLWATILQRTPFAGAYYHRDDPYFSKLACLFGLGKVKKEEDVEVVLISDRTEKVSADEPSCYEITRCDAEVTSPTIFPPRTVCRKLFPEDDEPPTNRESTNEVGICFIDLDADGQLRTRFEKGRDLPTVPDGKKDKGGPSRVSPNTSSCASNSPKQLGRIFTKSQECRSGRMDIAHGCPSD